MKVAKARNGIFCVLSILTGLENFWFALSEMRKRMGISVVEKKVRKWVRASEVTNREAGMRTFNVFFVEWREGMQKIGKIWLMKYEGTRYWTRDLIKEKLFMSVTVFHLTLSTKFGRKKLPCFNLLLSNVNENTFWKNLLLVQTKLQERCVKFY